MRILVINPGGSSTKIAVFDGKNRIYGTTIDHDGTQLKQFHSVLDQLSYRRGVIEDALREGNIPLDSLDAVAGRGGLLKELPGGVYAVTDRMVADVAKKIRGEHASNLGCVLAREIGQAANVPAYVVDPVSVDEFDDLSRITGIRDLKYSSWMHALNQKAVARKVAETLGGRYEDYNFIVAHLGSGVSVAPHRRGRMVDGSGGRSNGPFATDRSGGLPAYALIELCYSGRYSHKEMVDKVSSFGGMYDYLGTKDLRTIEARIDEGDAEARLILDAFVYQVSKEIAGYGATLAGKVDRIILTGGMAHSKRVVEGVAQRVAYLAPLEVVPGEMEMEALAYGTLRVLSGEEAAKNYDMEGDRNG